MVNCNCWNIKSGMESMLPRNPKCKTIEIQLILQKTLVTTLKYGKLNSRYKHRLFLHWKGFGI